MPPKRSVDFNLDLANANSFANACRSVGGLPSPVASPVKREVLTPMDDSKTDYFGFGSPVTSRFNIQPSFASLANPLPTPPATPADIFTPASSFWEPSSSIAMEDLEVSLGLYDSSDLPTAPAFKECSPVGGVMLPVFGDEEVDASLAVQAPNEGDLESMEIDEFLFSAVGSPSPSLTSVSSGSPAFSVFEFTEAVANVTGGVCPSPLALPESTGRCASPFEIDGVELDAELDELLAKGDEVVVKDAVVASAVVAEPEVVSIESDSESERQSRSASPAGTPPPSEDAASETASTTSENTSEKSTKKGKRKRSNSSGPPASH
ncbi:hypothetical protein HK097_002369, partial [Rhizophlyctis rosea]